MQAPDKNLFTMRAGAMLSTSDALFLANRLELAAENVAHTMVFYWNRKSGWSGQMLPITLHSIQAAPLPTGVKRALGISEQGQLTELTNQPLSTRSIQEGGDVRRPLSRLVWQNNEFYAVGGGGLVYRERTVGVWERLDQRIPASVLFESVASDATGTLYCVGWAGEVWRFDGSTWYRIDSPTNSVLTGVCVRPDGLAVACGQRGTVLRGQGDNWVPVNHEVTTENFWGVACYDGRVLLSSTHFLYQMEGDSLRRVSLGQDVPSTIGTLSVHSDTLMCVGEADVMALHNGVWSRIW
jgi:hypothetical protein